MYGNSLQRITRKFLKTNFFGPAGGLSFVARPIREKFYYRSDYGRNLRVINSHPECSLLSTTYWQKVYFLLQISLQVILHHVVSFPLNNENDIFAPMRKETNIEIDSIYNQADVKIQRLPTESRDCIFASERDLQHFPFYR